MPAPPPVINATLPSTRFMLVSAAAERCSIASPRPAQIE
jgi:hypothetical protein